MAVERGNDGNFGVGNAHRVGEGVGESAEAGAEDERDLRAQRSALQDELRGGVGECELVGHDCELCLQVAVGQVAAVAVAVQPIIQKCLVEIRCDDLFAEFVSFGADERQAQAGRARR